MEKISLESKIEILNNEMIQYKQSFERTTDLNSKLNSQLREMQAEIFKYQHQIFASVRYPSQMTSDGISLNAR